MKDLFFYDTCNKKNCCKNIRVSEYINASFIYYYYMHLKKKNIREFKFFTIKYEIMNHKRLNFILKNYGVGWELVYITIHLKHAHHHITIPLCPIFLCP